MGYYNEVDEWFTRQIFDEVRNGMSFNNAYWLFIVMHEYIISKGENGEEYLTLETPQEDFEWIFEYINASPSRRIEMRRDLEVYEMSKKSKEL